MPAFSASTPQLDHGQLRVLLAQLLQLPLEKVDLSLSAVAIGLGPQAAAQLLDCLGEEGGLTTEDILGAGRLDALLDSAAARLPPAGIAGATQQALCLLAQRATASSAYHLHAAFRWRCAADDAALGAAVAGLQALHPELSIVLAPDAQGRIAKRRVAFTRSQSVIVHEVAEGTAPTMAQRLQQALDAPIDLAAGPLFRLEWFREAGGYATCLLVAHHAIMDLWSFSQLLDDFVALLRGEAPAPRPRAAASFAQHAQRQALRAGESLARHRAFWEPRLRSLPPRLVFDGETSLPRLPAQSLPVCLDTALTTALTARVRSLGVTLNSALLALYALSLARFAAQPRVLVALPVAGRQSAALARTVGCFVNTLGLALTVDSAADLAALVTQVQAEIRAAQAHADLPFHQLLAELDAGLPQDRRAELQAAFVLQRLPRLGGAEALVLGLDGEACSVRGETLQALPLQTSDAPFDIGLMMIACGGRLHGRLVFRPQALSAGLAAAIGDYFVYLAGLLAQAPQVRLAALDGLLPAQRDAWLAQCRGDTASFPGAADLYTRFLEVAARRSDAPALWCDGTSLSYAALAGAAGALAAQLRARGAGLETRVAVLTGRCVETVVALLAIWQAGAVYVPVAEDAPPGRVEKILADCAPALLLATPPALDKVPAAWSSRLLPVTVTSAAAAGGSGAPASVAPDNLAYVIYTSGSEGLPKGVMISHAGAINFALSQAALLGVDENDRLLQQASFGFDASLSDVLMALLSGAALVIANAAQRVPGAEFDRLMREQAVSLITVSASLLDAIEEPEYPALRVVISTAEACTARIVARWGRRQALYNGYGPTEVTVGATLGRCVAVAQGRRPPIGRPFHNYTMYVLDEALRPLPPGVAGELYIGGDGVARGYLHDPGKTAQAFVPDPFSPLPGRRLYRSGDRGLLRADGSFECLGRCDSQIKIRGHRIELAEVERVLRELEGVRLAAVVTASGAGGQTELQALIEPAEGAPADLASWRARLQASLPDYMRPAQLRIAAVPLTANGKIDRRALLQRLAAPAAAAPAATDADSEIRRRLRAIWRQVLGHDVFSAEDNFFDVGGHSLVLAKVQSAIQREFGQALPLTALFRFHTLALLAQQLGEVPAPLPAAPPRRVAGDAAASVAIIGLALRLPGADSGEAFWHNLRDGRCGVRFFSAAELQAAGVGADQAAAPDFVAARAVLDAPYDFDAALFNCSEREAELLDPQRRLLLECCFEALQQAGYDRSPRRAATPVGAYLAASENSYFRHFIRDDAGLLQRHGPLRLSLAADKSFLATYVAYKLQLRGPALTVDTACSSSLVAVHEACKAIRSGDCEVALAGGMSIDCPQAGGHRYEEAGIGSRDGYCRAFDAEASGTVKGMGGGVVVLKDLAAAQRDGDLIHAVILGSAVNNDAGRSAGYTAPSVDGQREVIQSALAAAGVDAAGIDLLEAHGTGTPLGDPIEFAALREVFAGASAGRPLVGSVKSNIGHLDAAAGIAGLIKICLALREGCCPPSLHLRRPNPALGLGQGPLALAATATPLAAEGRPLRAGVSSFGIGGTNCHVVLGAADSVDWPDWPVRAQLLLLSSHAAPALQQDCLRLAARLENCGAAELAGAALSLAMRGCRACRRAVVAGVGAEAAALLRRAAVRPPATDPGTPPRLVFLFPGQAGQPAGLARELYIHEAQFRAPLDQALGLLDADVATVCRDWLLGAPGAHAESLGTEFLQPALFCYELALCRYLQSFGLAPAALLGHSLGEWVAAVVAGSLDLAGALALLQTRARLMAGCAPGAMLAVAAPLAQLRPHLGDEIEIAVDAGGECVLAGPVPAMAGQAAVLAAAGLAATPVPTRHAFHSAALDPVLDEFGRAAAALPLAPPAIPWLSNLSGDWAGAAECQDPAYWPRQMRATVQFGPALQRLLALPDAVFVVVGEGGGLARLVRSHPDYAGQPVVTPQDAQRRGPGGLAGALGLVAALWELGADIDAAGHFAAAQPRPRRLELPAASLLRKRYSLERPLQPLLLASTAPAAPELAVPATLQESVAVAQLRRCWLDLLGLDPPDGDTDFFAAGGDSLAVLRLSALLAERLGVRASVAELLRAPRFAEMAALAERLAAGGTMPLPAAQIRDAEAEADAASRGLPLSFQQRRMWLQHCVEDQPAILNLALCLDLGAEADAAQLTADLRALLQRHASLRLRLVREEGEPRQCFDRDPQTFRLALAETTLQDLAALARAEADMPFDLERDWLLRASLVRVAGGGARLLLTCHHLACDGHSLALLLRELRDGPPSSAGDSDGAGALARYIRRQADTARSGGFDSDLDYWAGQLAGLGDAALPGQRRDGGDDSRGQTLALNFPPGCGAALRAFCAEQGLTPFAVLLAAFAGLLGAQDRGIGVPVADRDTAELEDCVGLLVNTVVLRCRPAAGQGFAAVCRDTAAALSAALAHRQAPFDLVAERLQSARPGATRTPLFRVAVVQENAAAASVAAAAVQRIDKSHAQFPLALWLCLGGDQPQARLEFRSAQFDAAVMADLAGRLGVLLARGLASPETPLAQLLPAPAAGLSLLHGGPAEIVAGDSLARRLRAAATEHAGRTAVRADGVSLSYAALASRAAALAARLREQGVACGDRVGVHLPRSAELVVALYAGLLHGAVLLPLDVDQPPARLQHLLADGGARCLLTRSDLAGWAGDVARIDLDRCDLDAAAAEPADAGLGLDAPAYLIYTSGSSGTPKGVLCTTGGLLNRLLWMNRHYGFGSGERFLHKTPVSFDVALWELFCPLLCGACVVVAPPGDHRDPRALQALMAREQVSVAHFVPSMLREYLAVTAAQAGPAWVFCSGEGLPAQSLRQARAHWGPATRLVNLYGPTEAAIEISEWEYSGDCATPVAPLGRPISGTALYVLDAALQPLPAGEAGDLYLAGCGLALGYWQQPGLSAASFLPDPWAAVPGARMYRSGDRARLNADGTLEFLGRGDSQLKIHGQRVEPGEIEQRITALPGVAAAAVLPQADAGGELRLLAYVVFAAGTPPDTDLRAPLREQLPAYMLPARFIPLARLPLGANGKLDRAALPLPVETPAGSGAVPRSGLEQQLAAVWQAVLQRPVGRDSDFFAAGGSSIRAIRLAAQIEAATGLACPLRTVFDHPVLADLAAAMATAGPAETAAPAVALPPSPDADTPFALTELQAAYWAGRARGFELGNVATHGYLELDVQGLDLPAFRAAVQALVLRHEALRLVLDDQGRQRVLGQLPPLAIHCADLRGLAPAQRQSQLAALRARLAHRVYEPTQWPLFDFALAQTEADETRIFFSIDALIVDGPSVQLLEDALNAAYHACRAGLAPPPPDTGLPRLRDCVQALQARQSSPAQARAAAWWNERLADLPPAPALPLVQDPAALAQPRFSRLSRRLGARAAQRLQRRAAAQGTTLTALLLAAYAEVLASWSHATALTLNLTVSERMGLPPGVAQLAGNLSSLLILPLQLPPAASFGQRLASVRDSLVEALQQRSCSGLEVLRRLAAERGDRQAARMPVVFTSLVDLETPAAAAPRYFDFSRPAYALTQTSQVWLDCNVAWSGGELVVAWDAVAELFAPGMLAYFHTAYVELLARLADSDAAWQALPLPLYAGREALLWQSAAAGAAALGRGELLHEGFFARAAQQPDCVALAGAAPDISYATLAAAARRLALRLRAAGARPNQPVAVLMHNSWEQVLACLAIVAAGAPYLPVSAGLPAARRRRLLELGGCTLLLTTPAIAAAGIEADCERLLLDADCLQGEDPGDAGLPGDVCSSDLAYVMYTSGSTGEPKGVMIDHAGAVNTVRDISRRFGVQPGDAALALSEFNFDLAVYDVFGLLGAGGTLVVPAPAQAREPRAWLALINAHQVSLWNAVPALTQMLADSLDAGGVAPSLRLFLVSGDWIPVGLPARLWRHCPAARFISLGGATEASIWSIAHEVRPGEEYALSIPYGRALTAQSLLVLDPALRVCPPGVNGQLAIGGAGLARGYWNSPAQTAASFVREPLSGQTLYLTGDLGRYDAEGVIEFLGRSDDQVKIRGHRIELGEIAQQLLALPGVRQAVVRRHQPPGLGASLLAYVSLAEVPADAAGAVQSLAAGPAADWQQLCAAVQAEARSPRLGAGLPAPAMAAQLADLDRQYHDALLHLFFRLGLGAGGAPLSVDEVMQRGLIAPRYRRWVARALSYLAGQGYLAADGERWRWLRPLPAMPVSPPLGYDLPSILSETTLSAELYLSESTIAGYQKIFTSAHSLACAALESLREAHGDAPFDVLEVGAGHGSCTQHVLPLLPPGSRYRFTDISTYFLQAARERFAAYDCVDYALFDMDLHAQFQGLAPHSFDLIIAASVLHDMRDVRAALQSLHLLLKPGGTLLLIEETRFFPFFDLGMGLQQGFDGFSDTGLRHAHPLLSREQWTALLQEAGFAAAAWLGEPGSAADLIGFDLLLARMPARVSWLDEAVAEASLRAQLPDYMIPARCITLPRLPLSANGKVDRKALPLPAGDAGRQRSDFVAPEGPLEEALAALWSRVIGQDTVGATDNFFRLGGDSLLAVQLALRIQEQFGCSLPVRTVFEAPTVRELACLLELHAGPAAAAAPADADYARGTL